MDAEKQYKNSSKAADEGREQAVKIVETGIWKPPENPYKALTMKWTMFNWGFNSYFLFNPKGRKFMDKESRQEGARDYKVEQMARAIERTFEEVKNWKIKMIFANGKQGDLAGVKGYRVEIHVKNINKGVKISVSRAHRKNIVVAFKLATKDLYDKMAGEVEYIENVKADILDLIGKENGKE